MPIKATFTGDVTDLRRGTQQAREEFRKVGADAQGAARQLKAVGSSFDGSKLEGQAQRVARGIERIGGAARLTDTELARNSRTISEVLQKYERMGATAPASIRKLSDELKQATGAAKQLESASSGIGKGFSAFTGGLGIGVGAGAGLAAITALGSAISSVVSEGAKLSALSRPFEALQGSAEKAEQTLAEMRTATRGLVSEVDLLQSANKAQLLGLTALGVNMAELAGIATTLGRAMGQDAATSVDDLTTALGRQSPMILDNLGITVRVEEANQKYAASIGKSVSALTDQEKKLAFIGAAMDAARAKAATLGEVSLTVADQFTRIATTLTDAGARLASAGNESGLLSAALDSLNDTLEKLGGSFSGVVEKATDAASGFGILTKAFSEGVTEGDRLGQSLQFVVAPGINAVTLSLQGMEATLDKVRALQRFFKGNLEVTNLPSRTADIALPDRTFGQGARSQAWLTTEEARLQTKYIQEQDAALTKLEASFTKADESAKRLREELNKLVGRDLIANAVTLAQNLDKVGTANVLPASMPMLVEQLTAARQRASELGPEFASAVGQIDRKLRDLVSSSAYRDIFQRSLRNPTIGVNRNLEDPGFERTGIAGAVFPKMFADAPRSTLPQELQDVDLARARQSIAGITVDFGKGLQASRNFSGEVRNLAQSFAQLAQIAGPSMDDVTRSVGLLVASVDVAGQMVDTLGKAFNKDFNLGESTAGRALAGGLSGALQGWQIGTNSGMSPWRSAATGAASGALGGAAYGGVGAGVGAIVGATTAYFGAKKAEEELRRAKDLQAQTLVAQFGSLDELLDRVGKLGMSQRNFLERFYGDPKEFAKAVTELNNALTAEQKAADGLAKSLREVSRVQGVLSSAQLNQIRTMDPNGPGAEAVVEFAAQQRAQAEGGLASAIAALNQQASLSDAEMEELTRGITDSAERQRVIEAALSRKATETLARFGAGAQGAAAGLFVAFSEAINQGESALTVLQRLGPSIQHLQQLFARAGQSPGAGFEQLQVLSNIATGPQTAPAVQLAQGLGQALAGFANSGLLSPELFKELANGIGQAYKQLELLGQGGLEAARLMQPGLQAIWQMVQDNPALRGELDATTLALLDFAEKSGLIGEGFRPAIDQMIDAMKDLIAQIGDLVDAIKGVPGINIPVTYTPGELPPVPEQPAPPSQGGGSDGDNDPSTPFALGGIVTRPTRALIGEAGPEAVISLEEYRRLLQRQLQSQMGSARPWIGASANQAQTGTIVLKPIVSPVGPLTAAITLEPTMSLATIRDQMVAIDVERNKLLGRALSGDEQASADRLDRAWDALRAQRAGLTVETDRLSKIAALMRAIDVERTTLLGRTLNRADQQRADELDKAWDRLRSERDRSMPARTSLLQPREVQRDESSLARTSPNQLLDLREFSEQMRAIDTERTKLLGRSLNRAEQQRADQLDTAWDALRDKRDTPLGARTSPNQLLETREIAEQMATIDAERNTLLGRTLTKVEQQRADQLDTAWDALRDRRDTQRLAPRTVTPSAVFMVVPPVVPTLTPDDLAGLEMAVGGIVTRPTRALIGEAGDEAVVPLDRYDALVRSQVGPNRAWVGASANYDKTAEAVGRLGTAVNAATNTVRDALGGITTPLPQVRPDPPGDRFVSPITRERITNPDPSLWRRLEDIAFNVRPDDGEAMRPPAERLREVSDGWGAARISTDAQREAERQALIAATGGQWGGQSGSVAKELASPGDIVPLSRSAPTSAPIQITVVSQIDGYDAARAISRHQPNVNRLYYGAA